MTLRCSNSRFGNASVLLIAASVMAITMLATPMTALAVPASPDVHVLSQPDGTTFEAVQWGDEWLNGLETSEGHTIVYNETTGFWEYARLSARGELEPSGIRPGSLPPLEGIQMHLRPSRDIVLEKRSFEPGISVRVVPPTGTANVPVIMINFNDRTPTYFASDFQDLLFGHSPAIATGPGSLKDYYEEISYGAFSVSPGPAGVTGWFTAAEGHDYYGYMHGNTRAKELVTEAILAADPYIDFSKYDNDGDGYVDTVMIIHQGAGAEASRDYTDIWSHKGWLPAVLVDGVTIDSYIIQPETYRGGISSIGVFAHEFGHALGLPDLYDTDGSSSGVGIWCLMASGSWNNTAVSGDTPAHMSAWCKWYLGWVEPTLVRGTFWNRPIYAAAYTDDVLQLLPNPNGPSDWNRRGGGVGEYFLVENRCQMGFDAGLPGSGLSIWHIDESQGENWDEDHRLVDLKQADGLEDLYWGTNRGDDGDLYPGSANNRRFGDLTWPDNSWYDYRNTGCSIRNISDAGFVMTADVSQNCICTGWSYDFIGLLLWLEDIDYFDLRNDYHLLADREFLSLFEGVFVNSTDDLSVTPAMANALRDFVDSGGELLATDWAYPVITKAFPGKVNFLGEDPRIGVAGQVMAVVAQDPALVRYMGGDEIEVRMDLGYWAVIDGVASDVEVALIGDVQVDPTNPPRFSPQPQRSDLRGRAQLEADGTAPKGIETLRSKPLAVRFEYGHGYVAYSSLHFWAQSFADTSASDHGQELQTPRLRPIGNSSLERLSMWNVLAALTACERVQAAKAVEHHGCAVSDGVIDSAKPGECIEYEIDHLSGSSLVISAATGSGMVDMVVYGPDGRLAESSEIGSATVTMLIPEADHGKWILQARNRTGNDSITIFVACIGESASGAPELAAGGVRFGPNPARTELTIFYSVDVDADLLVYDVAGRMVYSRSLPASGQQSVWNLTRVDGEPLANGLYMCVVRTANGTLGKPFRLVIQR
ncbi:MAG: M6 family metalloprotease domain-containing protein [Firmicutes bacterium]|nr:M6 family metalloprotease domain-containing protein [Bacillota bacterium]